MSIQELCTQFTKSLPFLHWYSERRTTTHIQLWKKEKLSCCSCCSSLSFQRKCEILPVSSGSETLFWKWAQIFKSILFIKITYLGFYWKSHLVCIGWFTQCLEGKVDVIELINYYVQSLWHTMCLIDLGGVFGRQALKWSMGSG